MAPFRRNFKNLSRISGRICKAFVPVFKMLHQNKRRDGGSVFSMLKPQAYLKNLYLNLRSSPALKLQRLPRLPG